MKALKNLSVTSYMTCLTFLLGVISFILYKINVGSEGYFQGAAVPKGQMFILGAIIATLIVFVFSLVKTKGVVEIALEIISSVIRVLIPVLFIAAALTIASSRVEGFAFIYFSKTSHTKKVC